MSMRRSVVAVAALALATAIYCGTEDAGGTGSQDGGPGGGGGQDTGGLLPPDDASQQQSGADAGADAGPDASLGGTTPKEICDAWVKIICDREVACGAMLQSSYADCTAFNTAMCMKTGPLGYEFEARVTGGAQVVDSAKLQQCFTALAANPNCSGSADDFRGPGCSSVFSAGAANGDPCYATSDCKDGQCIKPAAVGDAGVPPCAATCGAWTADGQTCGFSANLCNPKTSFCNASSKCEALHASGSPCTSDSQCAPTDFCKAVGGADAGVGNRVCSPRAASGGTCGSSTAGPKCLAGLGCTGTCVEIGFAAGQACSSNSGCDPALYCKFGSASYGVCTARVADGQPCTSSSVCGVDSFCKVVGGGTDAGVNNKVCAPRVGPGATCGTTALCKVNLSCDSTSQKCVSAYAATGETCDPLTGDCYHYVGCDGTKCASGPVAAGKDCANDYDCAAGSYCDYGGTDTCVKFAAEGEACYSSFECAAGVCINSKCHAPCSY